MAIPSKTKDNQALLFTCLLLWQVLGAVDTLPEIYTELEISYFLLRRLLGVRTEGDKKGAKVGGKFRTWITEHLKLFLNTFRSRTCTGKSR